MTDAGWRMPTKHSLKKAKISLCVALGVHPDYAVEPGAHAGSQTERMSVRGMIDQAKDARPRGLRTALRYARAAQQTTVCELDIMMFSLARAWIAEVGVAGIPRRDSWAALTAWANKLVSTPSATELPMLPTSTKPPEPAPVEVADPAPEGDEAEVIEVDIEVTPEFC